jgi:protein O-mannosyl-transferase
VVTPDLTRTIENRPSCKPRDILSRGNSRFAEQLSPVNMSTSQEKRVVVFCLLLVAATLAFYNPIVRNQFVDFDDQAYILKNSHIQHGLTWDAVKWSFVSFYYGIWHPLTWMSHALDYQIFGLNPSGHHYVSLLIHAANAVLLFLLLWRATGFTWSSLIVAALFALHPINVESVAWAAERKNVLSSFFFLLALIAYDRYGRTGAKYLYWLVTGLFALGLLAKPQVVTLPFVLLLWDYWPLQRMNIAAVAEGSSSAPTPRSFWPLVWEKWPLFVLAVVDSVITVFAQRAGNSVRSLSEVSMASRLENVLISYVRYIGKMFWPSPLVPMYPRPENTFPVWQVAGAVVILIFVSALVLRWREKRYLLFGWCWFLGTLVPMIGIVTVGDQAMADRYAYIAFVGLFIAIVWTINDVASRRRINGAWLAAPAVIVLVLFGAATHRQLGYWHDNETLWRYTLSVTDRNYVAHDNLALALRKEGRSDEAVKEFRTGLSLHRYPPAQILALALYELQVGHAEEVIEDCTSVLSDSNDPIVRGSAFGLAGQAQLQLRHYEQAADSFQNALRVNPEDAMALMGSGVMALRRDQPDAAVAQFMHAVKVDPSDVNVILLAQALRRAGHVGEADSALAQVQRVSENPAQAQNAAGQILWLAGLKPL